MNKIRKGDQVIVIAGRDKGKKGEVITSLPKKNKLLVKGINIVKKTIKKSKEYPNGAIIDTESPIDVSNVMLICPKCNRPTRVGFVYDDDGKKYRICKKKDCRQKFE